MMFTTLRKHTLMLACALFLTSCGSDKSDSKKDPNQANAALSAPPVTGKIGGNDFIFKGGYARQTAVSVGPKPEDKSWSVWLYSEPLKQPCDMFEKHGSLLIAFSEPLQIVGRSEPYISLERDMDTQSPHIDVAKGVLDVDEVTKSKIVGRINVSFDNQSYAAGRFEVVKCPTQ